MALASDVRVGDVLERDGRPQLKVVAVHADFVECLMICDGAVTKDRLTVSAGALASFALLRGVATAMVEPCGAGRSLTLVVDDVSGTAEVMG